jgi:hypothetical protein
MQEQQSPSKEMKNLVISPISTGHSIFEEGKGGASKNVNKGNENKEWW